MMLDPSDAATELHRRRDSWSRYWQTGPLHSLGGSFRGNYEGGIRDFWVRMLAPMGPGHRVLDVGTGNGPIPALACELGNGQPPLVDAIDYADIAPGWIASAPEACRRSIRFHPHTSVEALPFPDAHFDLVTSQYALEYADLDRALAQISRVMKAGGQLGLVAHHAQSRLVDVAREEVRLSEWLLAPGALFDTAAGLYPYIAALAAGERDRVAADPAAAAARNDFNSAQRRLAQIAEHCAYPDILLEARTFVAQRINALLLGTSGLQATQAAHDEFTGLLCGAMLRQRELCDSALDADGIAHWRARLGDFGLAAEVAVVHHREHLMGWQLNATKAGG